MATKATKILRIVIRSAAIVGVIITFCDLRGYFIDKGRQAIYNQLLQKSSEYRVPITMPGVETFLEQFYFAKTIPADMRQLQIKGLMLKWIAIGNNPPMSGTVHVEFTNGKRSTSVCRLDELKEWSFKTPFYAWLGWWLLALSVSAELMIDIFNFREGRKERKSQQLL